MIAERMDDGMMRLSYRIVFLVIESDPKGFHDTLESDEDFVHGIDRTAHRLLERMRDGDYDFFGGMKRDVVMYDPYLGKDYRSIRRWLLLVRLLNFFMIRKSHSEIKEG